MVTQKGKKKYENLSNNLLVSLLIDTREEPATSQSVQAKVLIISRPLPKNRWWRQEEARTGETFGAASLLGGVYWSEWYRTPFAVRRLLSYFSLAWKRPILIRC